MKNSFSYAEVLSKLGYSTTAGHNSRTLKKRLQYYGIDVSHFTHLHPKRDWTDEEIFCENSKVSQNKLRKRFKQLNTVPYQCNVCGLPPMWNDKPLVLTLDHINGNHKDNRFKNLQWVCPNCDRQSDTYGYKNKKNLEKFTVLHDGNYGHNSQQDKNNYCIDCGKKISPYAVRCEVCYQQGKRNRPDKDNLFLLLKKYEGNFSKIGEIFNVTDNAVRKWCKSYGLPFYSKDYKDN